MNVLADKIRQEKARLERAKARAEWIGNSILGDILQALNEDNPGWNLRPTESDEVIVFFNQQSLQIADEISLNLSTGKLEPVFPLAEIGQEGLKTLLQQVKRKKRKWLRVQAQFEEALTRARESARRLDWKISEVLNT